MATFLKSVWIRTTLIAIILLAASGDYMFAQISPGKLVEAHAHLEGMSNCTLCHILGEKVSNDKCLDCHTELKTRIDQHKGYHSSIEIKEKVCVSCHSDHHGRGFEIIRFDEDQFDHTLTGYQLFGAHLKQKCEECHKAEFITDQKIKDKKYTYLGLKPECLACHDDYHQKTLSPQCDDCHVHEQFIPASKFDHNNTKYRLAGKHLEVACEECHTIEISNGIKFQEFSGIAFGNCTSCHQDVHNNRFGQDCRKCHTEESFHIIKGLSEFDHTKTDFRLVGNHQFVTCNSCHKSNYTDPVKHDRCIDCHADYHNNELEKEGISPDCSNCHNELGFSGSSFTIERHNEANFRLEGSHLATPCFVCHKKEERWSFRNIGIRCDDCHDNIHQTYISEEFYPDNNCKTCHEVTLWDEIQFDHSKTDFELYGAHLTQSCRSCHFIEEKDGTTRQRFNDLSSNCISCHQDVHYNQFDNNGVTDCLKCHDFNNWSAGKFNHDNTAFKLDGQHKNVACKKCHKPKQTELATFTEYKLKEFRCESCH